MPESRDPVEVWRHRLTPVSVDGLRTFVLDEGNGEPVVFLHGIPTQAFLWRDVADVVSRGWRAIAPDLLGFGFSDRPEDADYSPRGHADFLERVLESLGVERFALVVHDYGALVGGELLVRDPGRVTHIVVLNTSLRYDAWGGGRLNPFSLLKIPGVGETAFRLARPFMLRQAFGIYTSDKTRLTPEAMRVYWHPFEDGFAGVLLKMFRNEESRAGEDDFQRWRQAYGRFHLPALVVWGDLDRTFRSEQGRAIASLLPQGHFEVFDHANHFVPEDRPEALGRLIASFLSGRYKG